MWHTQTSVRMTTQCSCSSLKHWKGSQPLRQLVLHSCRLHMVTCQTSAARDCTCRCVGIHRCTSIAINVYLHSLIQSLQAEMSRMFLNARRLHCYIKLKMETMKLYVCIGSFTFWYAVLLFQKYVCCVRVHLFTSGTPRSLFPPRFWMKCFQVLWPPYSHGSPLWMLI